MTDIPASRIDYSALVDPVNKADVAAFRARMRAEKGWSVVNPGQLTAFAIVGVVAAVFVLSLCASLIGGIVSAFSGDTGAGFSGAVFPLLMAALFVALTVLLARSAFGLGSWTRWYRLSTFAAANGMEYSRSASPTGFSGAIFGEGSERTVTDLLRRSSAGAVAVPTLDIANYSYVTGSGKSRTTHRWGFMAISLDRAMPNMVLDSRANNGLFGSTNLPETFSKDQRLSLEGDFDKYFTLYCPKEYERDALYVFTPDLMALLIDEAAPFDVEIVDSWLFVYSATPFDTLDAATLRRLFRIVDTVGAKTLSQTQHYADERVGDSGVNLVAPQGRRLRRGFSALGVVAIVVVVALWLLPNVMSFLGH